MLQDRSQNNRILHSKVQLQQNIPGSGEHRNAEFQYIDLPNQIPNQILQVTFFFESDVFNFLNNSACQFRQLFVFDGPAEVSLFTNQYI